MVNYSSNFLDEVLSRSDVVEIIARHVELKQKGSNLMGLCPFHHEKNPSFSISADKQLYYCFGCGKGGGAFQFLMEHDGYSFPEAVEYLAEKAGLELPRENERDRLKDQQEAEERKKSLNLLAQTADVFAAHLHSHAGAQAKAYIQQRGLPEHIISSYGLGFAPAGYGFMQRTFSRDSQILEQLEAVGLLFKGERGYADRFRGRLMFPIRDKRGSVVGFGGRIIGDGEPKYLNSPETNWYHKSELLYGFSEHRDSIRKRKMLVVVEGYMDVLALAAYDLPIGLAASGTSLGEWQIREIFRLCESPVFCFDGDRAGYQAAWRTLERMLPLLKPEHRPRFLYLPDAEDPDSLLQKEGKEAFERRLSEQAKPVMETWLLGLSRLAGSGADGVARMAKKADEMLAKMSDPYLKQAWKQQVEAQTGLHLQADVPIIGQNRRFSLPRERAKVRSVKNFLHEAFLVGLIQKPSRLALLPSDAKQFFIDNDIYNRIYTRVFSWQGSEAYNGMAWAQQLQREFPEVADHIARWMNQEPVLDIEFSSVVLDMRKALLERQLIKVTGIVERTQLVKLKQALEQEAIKLNAAIEEQRRGNE
ncbi:MAG: DNA primase [Mariprofundaceae bacterium]|nr:DNA primase [Mariprofundaceae bacterium]